jgi:undecaprenyl-diphosphatase
MKSTAAVASLFGASAAASAGYAAISVAVARHETDEEDAEVRRAIVRRTNEPAKEAAKATGHIGKWYVQVPVALLCAGVLAKRRRWAGAAVIAGTSLAAAALHPILDRAMKFRAPPPGKGEMTQSYPSGHALEATAAFGVAAWVLARDRVVSPWIVAPIALLASAISGGGRLVLDRHWISDGAAGYCAGLALASAGAGIYEVTSR